MFPQSGIMPQHCPTVVYTADNLFTCSQDTAVKMAEVIKEKNLTRVVVASCSPRTHEGLVPGKLRKGRSEQVSVRDGQYPRSEFLGAYARTGSSHRKSQRSAAHGCSQGSVSQTVETRSVVRQSSGFDYRRRFGRYDRGSVAGRSGICFFHRGKGRSSGRQLQSSL